MNSLLLVLTVQHLHPYGSFFLAFSWSFSSFSSLADLPVDFLRVAFHVVYLSVGCTDQGTYFFQDNRLFQLFQSPHCFWSFLRQ